MSWFNVCLVGRKGRITLKTFAGDAAQACEQVAYIFSLRDGFRVVDVKAV